MASSSDWIAEAQNAADDTPGWIAALSARGGFTAGWPFAESGQSLRQPQEQDKTADAAGDAIAKAFAEGEAMGRESALAEAEQANGTRREFRLAFRSLDQAAMDALAADLADTVLTLCRQVIDERAIDGDTLVKRCHGAANRIGAAAGQCSLRLHPDDIALVGDDALAGWQVQPEPTLERGGLLLEGPDGQVRDGPAEWRRAIAAALHQ